MSNERINLTELEEQFKDGLNWDDMNTMNLIAELKRCYEEINLVHRNLSIVRNALARGYPDIEEEIWKLIDASE